MKKIQKNFFAKTLTVSLMMLLSMTLIAYLLFYLLLPIFYRRYKLREYESIASSLTQQLSAAEDTTAEISVLSEFIQQDTAGAAIYNADGSVLFQVTENVGLSVTQEAFAAHDFEMSVEVGGEQDQTNISAEYPYSAAGGEQHKLVLDIPLQPLDEAKAVMIDIYPLACLICIGFSFLLSMLFSHIVVKPIRRVQRVVREMAELKPDARISEADGGAFADMSRDINSMYEELHSTIVDLENQIHAFSDSENQKISFLRNVSHELKTPLSAANALIEGIIYDIPPYCNEREKYLGECQTLLQKAITLTKESLNLSPVYHEKSQKVNLKNLVETEFRPYKVILKSRQIRYTVDVPDDIEMKTAQNLFSKVLSNVFSNAANYTDPGGLVRIRYTKGELLIENTCTPLTKDELKTVMKPMQSGKKKHPLSNGLGLFIVEQSLGLLKIPFTFAPMPDGSGMRFTIRIQKQEQEADSQ